MPKNPAFDRPQGVESPATGSIAINPDDNSDLATEIRAITIGGTAGTVRWTDWNGLVENTKILPQGTYAMLARRIWSTGTTATEITGWI